MSALGVRPQALFAFLFAALLAVESAVLQSQAMRAHPQPLRAAVLIDLCMVPPGLWWVLVVRRGLSRPRSTLRVALLSIALCAAIFGAEVRLLGVAVELAILGVAANSVRKVIDARAAGDGATALRVGLVGALGDSPVTRAVATELAILWYALFSWGRRPPDQGFTAYKRAGWIAIESALAVVCLVEAIPLHVLFIRWSSLAAALSAIAHVYALLWLVGDLRALALRPLRVEGGTLHLRIGLRWEADIPLHSIAFVERCPDGRGMRLGVIGAPNLVLELRSPQELQGPFGIRRTSDRLLLQVDQPDALASAIARARR
ncbi:MAG: hypothetical protein NVS2B9_20450 [Myxococcales bacterium]